MAGDVEPEILKHEGHEGATSVSHEEGALARPAKNTKVLVVPGFLTPTLCARVREAMDAGTPEPADILGDSIETDESVRRTLHIEIDDLVRDALEERLDAARPQLEAFFGIPLGVREGPSVLRYTAGGFYRRHCDQGQVSGWPAAARRCVATVLFLTSSRTEAPDGTFAGGTLRLFAGDEVDGCDVRARAGTLVAFPATLPHEVTLVTEGVRDTAVDWFECRSPNADC
jgi:predicted 2-oxoglutarate/Fe(II)-dependent dioxygenase YbiX